MERYKGDCLTTGSTKITVRIPDSYMRQIDFLVEVDDVPSRSEAIRAAVRDFIYERVRLATENVKKMRETEVAMAQAEEMRKEYLKR